MDNKKQMVWMFAGLCVVVVGLAVYLVLTQFGGGSKAAKADESVVAALPDGEVQEMASSKSEAFRGSVSTDEYFEMLGALEVAEGENISLVSDSLKKAPAPVVASAPAGGSAVDRVFGPAPSSEPSVSSAPRRSGGGSSSAG